jgi:quercetin dioxygenase-like cupin family protein
MTAEARKINVTKLYSDSAGESHFVDETMELREANFAPPAPPMYLSTPAEAQQTVFLMLPTGYFGDLHPAPRRQQMTLIDGALEVRVSDGEVRQFHPGETVLVEDTTGKGHATKSVKGESVVFVVQM